jgi:hypothetical protein
LLQFLGVVSSAAPTELASFPTDLSLPAVHARGIFPDGWMAKDASATLAAGGAGELVLRAEIPPRGGEAVTVDVDGSPVISSAATSGTIDLRARIPAAKRNRRIDLHWSSAGLISSNDPRVSAGRLILLAVRSPKVVPSPVVADAGFERTPKQWTEVDNSPPSLLADQAAPAKFGARALRLRDSVAGSDDYYTFVARGVRPATEYVVSGWVETTAFTSPAIEKRGLYAIARAGNTYDGQSAKSANIAAASTDWQRKSVVIKTGPVDDSIEVRLYAPEGDTSWDNIAIAPKR